MLVQIYFIISNIHSLQKINFFTAYSSERIKDLHTDFHTDLQSDLQTPCDLYLTREIKHPTSNTDTLIHFLKANIGTGRVPFGLNLVCI